MNETQFQVMNPLATTIDEGELIIQRLQAASEDLQYRIADRNGWYERYAEAKTTYEMAESERLGEAVIAAQVKEGPLGGVAATSKAYDILLTNIKIDLKHGELSNLWDAAEQTRKNYESANTALEQAQTAFNALRKVADVKAQILRASTI